MKIFTLGKGFVASHLSYQKINDRLDSSSKQIESIINSYKPDVIINAIGFCGVPNIDQCEIEKEKTVLTNTVIPTILATECQKYSIHLINIGSGCVFFGESPNKNNYLTERKNTIFTPDHPDYFYASFELADSGWEETDFANPGSYYSKTKYACDMILGDMKCVTTLRIRMPLSTQNNSRNLINKLRGYRQIIDIPNSVTFMNDLVKCIDWVAKNSQTGIFHVTNPGTLSAVNVMTEYQKYMPDHKFEIISSEELDKLTIAKRSNCVLNADKLKNAGFEMMPAKGALQDCMAQYIKNI